MRPNDGMKRLHVYLHHVWAAVKKWFIVAFNVDSNEKYGSCRWSRRAGEEHTKCSQFRRRRLFSSVQDSQQLLCSRLLKTLWPGLRSKINLEIKWKVLVLGWFYVRPRRVLLMSVFYLLSGGWGGAGRSCSIQEIQMLISASTWANLHQEE